MKMKSNKQKRSQEDDLKRVINNGLITCSFYMCAIVFLHHFNLLYKIGKFETIYLVPIIIIFDFIKSLRYPIITTQQKTEKLYLIKSFVLILMSIFIYAMIAIAFGAPFLSNHEETLMFATILTALTTMHSLIYIGYKNTVNTLLGLTNVDGNLSLTEITLRIVQCTLVGAWAGSVVIPLDWNRPWQEWPIPCTVGALLGFIIGHLIQILWALQTRHGNFKDKKQFV